jgi:hypothetical protein
MELTCNGKVYVTQNVDGDWIYINNQHINIENVADEYTINLD